MDNTKSDFRKRKDEIDEYFSFLSILNNDNVSIKYSTIYGDEEMQMSVKLQGIFIANTFLLLYNLVESTIRNSIIDIYNKIKYDELKYIDLSQNIKQIWLHKKKQTLISNEGENKNKSIERKLESIIDDIVNDEIIILTNEDIHISGNIDAQEIRNLSKKIGFEKSRNGRDLKEIKEKRNRLAHGEHTFHDVGKNFTYNDLYRFKENTFEHLNDVIEKIEIFITNEKYLLQ